MFLRFLSAMQKKAEEKNNAPISHWDFLVFFTWEITVKVQVPFRAFLVRKNTIVLYPTAFGFMRALNVMLCLSFRFEGSTLFSISRAGGIKFAYDSSERACAHFPTQILP